LPNAYQEGPSDRACFSRTGASPPAAAAGCAVCLAAASAAAGTGACMTCMVPTVLPIHVRQAQVQLPRLPQSATKASLAKLLLHRHPSGATQNISNVPKYRKTRRRLHGMNPEPSQRKFNHRTVLDSNVPISQDGPRFPRKEHLLI